MIVDFLTYSFSEVVLFEILEKKNLHESAVLIKINAPLVVKNALPGQFVILRATSSSERIPLTIFDCNKASGVLVLIFQVVGAATAILNSLTEGDKISDVVGPLGKPSLFNFNGCFKVCVVGGGVGCANIFSIAKRLKQGGAEVFVIAGFRSKNLVILKNEFENEFENFVLTTDDGSCGEKGLVTDALEKAINSGNVFDLVFVAGPLIMMKFVCNLTKKFKIKTIVSMNPIMIDGTGMCGSCRLTVGNEVKFACVDGPDFDGHLVNFDESIARLRFYKKFEKKAHSKICNLLKNRGLQC